MARSLQELRKLPNDSSMTPEEKKQLYGEGCPHRVMYRKSGSQIVSRTFAADQPTSTEWVDSPAKLGMPDSHPERSPDGPDPDEVVVGTLPAGEEAEGENQKGQKAAVGKKG